MTKHYSCQWSVGDKKHFFTIIKIYRKNDRWWGECLCECGNIKHIRLSSLNDKGGTRSCGCHRSNRMKKLNKQGKYSTKHGLCYTRLYNIFHRLQKNKNKLAKIWIGSDKIEQFCDWAMKNGYNDNLVLMKIDNMLLYSPNNCKWATRKQRSSYKKLSQEITIDNITKSFGDWMNDERCNISYNSIKNRIKCGWQIKDAFFTPKFVIPKSNITKQQEVQQWLESVSNYKFLSNQRILDGKEIDIYCEELKLGIEYCGLYWHTDQSKYPRDRSYHYNKYKKCQEHGIRLITIFSDEWNFRQLQVKNFLKSVLGVNKRIHGRKCIIKQIDKNIGQTFIEENHIQGQKRKALIYFGLFYNDELVGCLSLNYHHRNNDNNGSIVLDRLCFMAGYTIIGGASKLFNYAVKWCVKNSYSKIISWSDNRWSVGDIYYKLGFEKEQELKPDYFYIKFHKPKKRISKQSMRKKNINCPSHMTEKEYCTQLGFGRIWDCGKQRFKYYI